VVTLNDVATKIRRTISLGRYGTPESREKYNRLISTWMANGRRLSKDDDDPAPFTVGELIDRYYSFAEGYYRDADGKPTSEIACLHTALKIVNALYGSTAAVDFGPLALKAVRQAMITSGWVRDSINKQVSRVRRMFRWGVSEQLVPSVILIGLEAVQDLAEGRCEAAESEPVKPVDEQHVYAALEWLSAQVQTMVKVQLLCGMRPGELCIVRPCDIDRTGTVWVYHPQRHKNTYRDQDLEIYIGPKAQALLTPYLLRAPEAYCFSPAEAERTRRANAHAARKTPLGYGNGPGRRSGGLATSPKRTPRDRYTTGSYRRAIARGCDKADAWAKGGLVIGTDERMVPCWHPHQLRHTVGTRIRAEFGVEGSQVILGHKTLDATQIYAERNRARGKEIMSKVG
jgi:integrase